MITQQENKLTRNYPPIVLALKYGMFTTLGLIVYFLFIKLLGFEHVAELRYFNAAIMFGGVFFAFKEYFGTYEGERPTYFNGLLMGVMVCVATAAMFAILTYLYLKVLDPTLAVFLLSQIPFEISNMGLVVLLVFFEGAMSGIIISFIAMQYYK